MENLDIDKLIGAMNSPEFGANTKGLMEMLGEVNSVLSRLQKTMSMLDDMGIKPLIVRAAGAKLGVDAETPLKSDKSNGIIPASTYHKQVLAQFNSMSEDQLGQMLSVLLTEESKEAIKEPLVELDAVE